ncbi:MAG: (2Fe-2S)-binding protein [Pseudomonadota bacterium]
MTSRHAIAVGVNGRRYEKEVSSRMLLSDFLRDTLGLTGTHVGCEHGICGCCTVLLNGASARSCLCLAVQADGAEITTVEGLGDVTNLNLLQKKFREHHALQCGFCTPGMLITVTELLSHKSDLSDDDIREAISGNICRCTGYEHIVQAVRAVLNEQSGGQS